MPLEKARISFTSNYEKIGQNGFSSLGSTVWKKKNFSFLHIIGKHGRIRFITPLSLKDLGEGFEPCSGQVDILITVKYFIEQY